METEIEAKFLRIDTESVRRTLVRLGAELVHPERLMPRINLDYADKRLEKIGGWVRLRDEGDAVTLAYKQMNDRSLHGTKEVSVKVSDFERTKELLEAIGLVAFGYQEARRELWRYKNCEITLDTWPWLPTFAEVEGPSEEAVREAAADVGFDWESVTHGSVEVAYQDVYDIAEEIIWRQPEIRFGPVPDWLEVKRRT